MANTAGKTAVIVFSDPASGSDEALGRLFNALILTHELKEDGSDVDLLFQGAGSRWPAEVSKADHPAHGLYEAVKDRAVICGGCADVFGATEGAEASGLKLVRERDIPGTNGVADLSRYVASDARVVAF